MRSVSSWESFFWLTSSDADQSSSSGVKPFCEPEPTHATRRSRTASISRSVSSREET